VRMPSTAMTPIDACAGAYSYLVLHSLAQTPFGHSIGPPTYFEALQLPSMH
jgi:hypothetical protein